MKPGILYIWLIVDGKKGHESQSEGLAKGLSEIYRVSVKKVPIKRSLISFCVNVILAKRRDKEIYPNIVIGTGRQTHWPLLFCKKIFGSLSICLMKPSIPTNWFDLCVVPRHDGLGEGPNVFVTEGPINLMEYSKEKNSEEGLILVGGESGHYKWENDLVLSQVKEAINSSQDVSWTISDSRRTPERFRKVLTDIDLPKTKYIPCAETKSSWLVKKLKSSNYVWITPDSIGMIYEALSSGALVGTFLLREKRSSRVTKNLDYLIENGWVRTIQSNNWQPPKALDERARTAKHIKTKWAHLSCMAK